MPVGILQNVGADGVVHRPWRRAVRENTGREDIGLESRLPRQRLKRLQAVASELKVFGEREVDFRLALKWLAREWNVKSLVCEGGGEVNDGLLRAGLVDEIYVTICPLIFGGNQAPTMADGGGFGKLSAALDLKERSRKRIGDELYLVYGAGSRTKRTRSKS